MDLIIGVLRLIMDIIHNVLNIFLIFFNGIVDIFIGLGTTIITIYNECTDCFSVAFTYLSSLPEKVWLYMFCSFTFSLLLYFINKMRGD